MNCFMRLKPFDLPADLESAYLALLAEQTIIVAERDVAVAQAANAQAMLSDNDALIAALELKIEKLRGVVSQSFQSVRSVLILGHTYAARSAKT